MDFNQPEQMKDRGNFSVPQGNKKVDIETSTGTGGVDIGRHDRERFSNFR